MSPALAGGFLTTVPPGKSHKKFLKSQILNDSWVKELKEEIRKYFESKKTQKHNVKFVGYSRAILREKIIT